MHPGIRKGLPLKGTRFCPGSFPTRRMRRLMNQALPGGLEQGIAQHKAAEQQPSGMLSRPNSFRMALPAVDMFTRSR